jgi:hypothetical protein
VGNGNGNGDGQRGNGNGQDGKGQALLAYSNNAAQFFAAWNTARATNQFRDNIEQKAINCSPAQYVQFAAMLKINLRL